MIKLPSLEQLPSLKQVGPLVARTGSKTTALVQWDRTEIRYLVVKPEKNRLRWVASGQMERDLQQDPFSQLAAEFADKKKSVRRLLVVLSRADLEVATLHVPPTEKEELPEMVTSLIEQEFGENDAGWVVDYTVSRTYEDSSAEVIAFAAGNDQLQEYVQQAKQHQMTLEGIIPRSLASLGLLRRATTLSRPRSVAIVFCNGHVDISVLDRTRPTFLRSVRVATKDPQELAKRSSLEIQRCLAATGEELGDAGQPPHLFVFGNLSSHQEYVDALANELNMPVSLVDPLEHLVTNSNTPEEDSYLLAPLLGAACEDLLGKLDVDLLHPRRAPQPTSPVRRWAIIGGALAALVFAGAYVLWMDRMELRQELTAAKQEFDNEADLAKKMLERVDDVRAVEAWMEQDVNWLDELRDFSQRLPPGDVVTIRRLSGSSRNGAGNVSLSVRVSDPADVAILENQLRSEKHSVTSNRVSERAADEEYPWQFETRIAFEPRSKTEYQPGESAGEALAGTEAASGEATESSESATAQNDKTASEADEATRAADEQPVSTTNKSEGGR